MNTQDEIKYQEALKRVKKLKGFYTHAIVYVFINIFIFFLNVNNLNEGESYFQLKNLYTIFLNYTIKIQMTIFLLKNQII